MDFIDCESRDSKRIPNEIKNQLKNVHLQFDVLTNGTQTRHTWCVLYVLSLRFISFSSLMLSISSFKFNLSIEFHGKYNQSSVITLSGIQLDRLIFFVCNFKLNILSIYMSALIFHIEFQIKLLSILYIFSSNMVFFLCELNDFY